MNVNNKYCFLPKETYKRVYLDVNKIDPSSFYGDVLYLGLGDAFLPEIQSKNVLTTTIVEINENLVNQKRKLIETKGWKIIQEDAYMYVPEKKYDLIFADIWYQVQEKETVFGLIESYKPFVKDTGRILYLNTIIKK
jgi:spermidine synthase